MKSYSNFIGIDIGKFSFFVAVYGQGGVEEFENTPGGIKCFFKKFKKILPEALCVLEPTGGYEIKLLWKLCEQGFTVHRAHTRRVKDFIRSLGNGAKTDRLDARNLSLYGFERGHSLERFTLSTTEQSRLYELVQRRKDLKQMMVAEKNRLQAPRVNAVRNSIEALLSVLSQEIKAITEEIDHLIEQNQLLKERKKLLISIAGIGNIIANELLVLLPELGQLSRREIASLAGLAPISRDSGKLKGYRRTGHGREGIKPMLFLAAMAARNSKSELQVFYLGLLDRGKNKMVALTALMRKILVIANARLKTTYAT